MTPRITVPALVCGAVLISHPALAQQSKKPPAPKPATGTLGTEQMKGGEGLFGTTYTVANNGGYVYNVAIVSAEYSVARHNIDEGTSLAPKADEKLLILHLRAQNPNQEDEYFSGNFVTFSTVAKDDQTRDHNDYLRLASTKAPVGQKLKPGQKFPEELLMACIVPAKGPVPKLILNIGRKGTSEEVTRYFLGKAPNLVKPLPAPFADPSDSTGATALAEIPAQVGTVYPAAFYDIRLDSVAFAAGPIGEAEAGDGKRFLVATVTVTNKTWQPSYFNGSLAATLATSDDEKTELDDSLVYKGKRDERWEGRKIDPYEAVTIRLLFPVPKDVTGKTLKIAEIMDNVGTKSRAFVYDVSSAK